MIRYVIFDVMGVVFEVGDDVEGMLIPYVHSFDPNVDAQKIRDNYLAASLGKITSHELWADLGFDKAAIPKIERDYLEKSYTLDPEFIPCAKALKERYRIALLSNDVSEWSRFLREFYGVGPLVERAFISGDLGIRKPDPKIFLIVLDSLGVKPGECLFIDDYPDRVDTGLELGISSILFNREGYDYSGMRITSFSQLTQLLL